jgi:group II intron reverse transcriptase/maturase
MKNILEPVFEADFYPSSNGFRPGKGVHRALEQLRKLLRPRFRPSESGHGLPYQWAIEGDIKGCFDNIDHHALMERLRRRIGDTKVLRLVRAFLKSGVLSEDQVFRTDSGTPQGGILSPLLANVALSAVDERYERYVWPRRIGATRTDPKEIEERAATCRNHDRNRGRFVYYPIRYADDFIILVSAPRGREELAREAAFNEKTALAMFLKEQLNLELSESKTLVTPVTATMRFLGHHVRVRGRPGTDKLVSTTLIPKDRSQRLRWLVKRTFARSGTNASLANRLQFLNPMLRGWAYFYRHAWGAKRVFNSLDHHVWWTILRWLRKKHQRTSMAKLAKRYGWRKRGCHGLRWQDGGLRPFELATVRVRPFMLWTQNPPDYARDPAESPVHNERCTPGSEGGSRKPADESR